MNFYTDWKARQPCTDSIQHQERNPEPQKWVTDLRQARLELLPKPDRFKTHLRDSRAPGRINSSGVTFLISLVAPITLKSGFRQQKLRVLHDEYRRCSHFSLRLHWSEMHFFICCPLFPTITITFRQLIQIEKTEATRNKRSEIFQIEPALLPWL